jgi:phosphatidylserine decarboxylase
MNLMQFISAKYQPYDSLRQRFWRQYMKQYDMEETGGLTHLEFTSMLDSLGSTLSHKTFDTFFEEHNKKPHESELTYAEAIQCLEAELGRPDSERKLIESDDSTINSNGPTTPGGIVESESTFMKMSLGDLNFSGSPLSFDDDDIFLPFVSGQEDEQVFHPLARGGSCSSEVDVGSDVEVDKTSDLRGAEDQETFRESEGYNLVERVINVKNCPLCHRPRLNSKAEVDIVTHLAVCASQDWAKVDRIVVGSFVTASQAQRKWYTKVISKVSSGNYKLGAVSLSLHFRYWKCTMLTSR